MDIKRFIEEEEFIQCQPMGVDAFISYCKKRGISTSRRQLEYFEKTKLFCPILRIQRRKFKERSAKVVERRRRNIPVQSHKDSHADGSQEAYEAIHFEKDLLAALFKLRYIMDPTNKDFTPWIKYHDAIIGDDSHLAYYSQFQVYSLYKVLQRTRIELEPPLSKNLLNNRKSLLSVMRFYEALNHNLKSDVKKYERVVELAISLQNRYLPYAKSDQRTISVTFPIEKYYWDWHEYRKKWDPEKTKKRLATSVDELEELYNRIRFDADQLDPLEHWSDIIKFISYDKRERLKDQALLAQDLYAMALMIKIFYENLSDQKMPTYRLGGDWEARYYGTETIENASEYLEYLANQYHLNPRPRLILVVEGVGEYENIPRIAKSMGLDFNYCSIRAENLQGIGNLKHLTRFIDHYHNLQTIVYVLLDNENRVRQFRSKLLGLDSAFGIRRKVTKPEYVSLWDRNFEYDNYSDSEIAEGMINQGRPRYSFQEQEIKLSRMKNSNLAALYKARTGHDLDKRVLADYLANFILSDLKSIKNTDTLIKKRRIVGEIIKIVNFASANYFPNRRESWRESQELGFCPVKDGNLSKNGANG